MRPVRPQASRLLPPRPFSIGWVAPPNTSLFQRCRWLHRSWRSGHFVAAFGNDPLDLYFYLYQGAFGTWFSWQNTLTRAAPLILTALCTALPAHLGMVIIGGEGALLIGALSATAAALALPAAPPLAVQVAMAIAGMVGGGLWIALAGALRQYRGVNETISSLLLVYIALAILNQLVEGPMRDPDQPQQTLDPGDPRRHHDRIDPRHRYSLGLRVRRWSRRSLPMSSSTVPSSASRPGSRAAMSAPPS